MNEKRIKIKRKNLSCTTRATSFLGAGKEKVGITDLMVAFIWRRGSIQLHLLRLERVKHEDHAVKKQALRCLK